MSRAEFPSSPSGELAARRSWSGPTLADGALTPEIAAFCQSGLSVALATTDRAGRPVVGRGLACRIDAEGRVRIVLRQPSNAALMSELERGAAIAATFTKPSTHRSIQLKASGARVAGAADGDAAAVAVQTAAFAAELVDVGYSAAFSAGYVAYDPFELAAVEFLPAGAFVQTPGPGAGSVLQP